MLAEEFVGLGVEPGLVSEFYRVLKLRVEVFVVNGTSRLAVLPSATSGGWNGLPPPKIQKRPPATPPPGTLFGLSRLDDAGQYSRRRTGQASQRPSQL